MSGRVAAILICFMLSSCATVEILEDFPCPPRPTLEAITAEQQMEMDAEVVGKIAKNQLKLKTYAKQLEVRAGCEW